MLKLRVVLFYFKNMIFVSQLDSYEIGEGKILKVNVSEPKTRLFIGNIPKSKGKDEIEEEFKKLSGNIKKRAIISSHPNNAIKSPFSFIIISW